MRFSSRTMRHASTAGVFGDRRGRILDAMVALVCERGFAGVSVSALCASAKVSRRTFYDEFDSRENCFLELLDEGLCQASGLIVEALERAREQEDVGPVPAVREALVALLAFMEEHPQLARVWLVESLAAGKWALEHRERNITHLVELILERSGLPPAVDPLMATGVMASVLGLLQRHILADPGRSLMTMLGPLVRAVSVPYIGSSAAQAELEVAERIAERMIADATQSPSPAASGTVELPMAVRNSRSRRARECVLFLAQHPGVSNRQVATAVGIRNHSQASALLARLQREGLLYKIQGRPGHPNQWSLTTTGHIAARGFLALEPQHMYESHHGTDAVRGVTS